MLAADSIYYGKSAYIGRALKIRRFIIFASQAGHANRTRISDADLDDDDDRNWH